MTSSGVFAQLPEGLKRRQGKAKREVCEKMARQATDMFISAAGLTTIFDGGALSGLASFEALSARTSSILGSNLFQERTKFLVKSMMPSFQFLASCPPFRTAKASSTVSRIILTGREVKARKFELLWILVCSRTVRQKYAMLASMARCLDETHVEVVFNRFDVGH